jgi:hypothetical protein
MRRAFIPAFCSCWELRFGSDRLPRTAGTGGVKHVHIGLEHEDEPGASGGDEHRRQQQHQGSRAGDGGSSRARNGERERHERDGAGARGGNCDGSRRQHRSSGRPAERRPCDFLQTRGDPLTDTSWLVNDGDVLHASLITVANMLGRGSVSFSNGSQLLIAFALAQEPTIVLPFTQTLALTRANLTCRVDSPTSCSAQINVVAS